MDVAARDLGVRSQDRLGAVKWAVPNTGRDESRMRIFGSFIIANIPPPF